MYKRVLPIAFLVSIVGLCTSTVLLWHRTAILAEKLDAANRTIAKLMTAALPAPSEAAQTAPAQFVSTAATSPVSGAAKRSVRVRVVERDKRKPIAQARVQVDEESVSPVQPAPAITYAVPRREHRDFQLIPLYPPPEPPESVETYDWYGSSYQRVLVEPQPKRTMDAQTDGDGIAEFELPPGRYLLMAWNDAGAGVGVEELEVTAATDNNTGPIEVMIAVPAAPRNGP